MTSKVFIISGFAGSGKDTVSDMIGDYYEEVNYVAFAEKFKEIISRNLPQDLVDLYGGIDREEILDRLKNDDINVNVFAGMNMREFLKNLLGGAIRDINKDIHSIYVLEKIYEIINKDRDAKIIATDNRYVNEQDYLLGLNALDSHEDKIDYILSQISHTSNELKSGLGLVSDSFNKHLIDGFRLNKRDWDFLEKIKWDFIKSIKELQKKPSPKRLHSKPNWSGVDFSLFDNDDFLRLGVIRVFRSIIDNDFNSGFNKDCLIEHVIKHSGMEMDLARRVVDDYASWRLGTEDMKKYGFCRTNPTSPSEIELINAGRTGCLIENNYKHGLDSLRDKVFDILKKMDDLDVKKKSKPSKPNPLSLN